jgi:hypothetical protein
MACCGACIGRHLTKVVQGGITGIGTCAFCGSQNQTVVEPATLRDAFELLAAIYVPDEGGRPLLDWLRNDWAMFEEKAITPVRASELLAAILEDSEVAHRTFIPSELCRTGSLEKWQEFRRELMHANRFFPTTALDLERLRGLLSNLSLSNDELPLNWFRARLQKTQEPYVAGQMRAPPKDQASHGRANPAGIPYLYLASTEGTAIAETRPHTGERATIAHFSLAPDTKVVDLRSPRRTVSPFKLSDVQQVAFLRGDVGYLEQLGEELTRPVLPHAAAIDYLPSQYLCEFVKKCDFHGVVYRSSVGGGINLALFDDSRATIGGCSQWSVSSVAVEINQIEAA